MILDLIRQSLGEGEMDQIGRRLGAGPKETQQAIAAALPLLLGALGRNSSQPQGQRRSPTPWRETMTARFSRICQGFDSNSGEE